MQAVNKCNALRVSRWLEESKLIIIIPVKLDQKQALMVPASEVLYKHLPYEAALRVSYRPPFTAQHSHTRHPHALVLTTRSFKSANHSPIFMPQTTNPSSLSAPACTEREALFLFLSHPPQHFSQHKRKWAVLVPNI